MAQGNDGAYDTELISSGGPGGSEETIAHVGRVVTVAFQPVSRIGLQQGEHSAPSMPHHRQDEESTHEDQKAGFADYACMPRLPPRSSLRLPPHALSDDATLPASKTGDELAELSNTDHLAVTEAFKSENGDVPVKQTIANLQQQLRDKTDEANQLRSLLESTSDPDSAMLREQLRLVGRECLLWRTRAEVAEKRVATFKRLAARVKAMKVGEGMNNVTGPALQPEAEMNEADDEADDEADVQDEGMRRVEQWLEQDRRMDSSGEHTEDGGVVAARIRESLRAIEDRRTETTVVADVAESHYDREDEGSMSSQNVATTRAKRPPPQGLCRHRYRSSASDGERDGISAAVASMWVAAEGML
ncbi:hypothetical protein B0T18DRAFT_386597 [Schizothecium vesticola]|uniref:Uncharacterized protein n=1 Tax=Schizothecium vesticola TaxID=314040 RepID=A0AA40FBK0_9PEZI|nr:hypothetical protein B0T18DRAFT_386597 [Schizothecium vesticola]